MSTVPALPTDAEKKLFRAVKSGDSETVVLCSPPIRLWCLRGMAMPVRYCITLRGKAIQTSPPCS